MAEHVTAGEFSRTTERLFAQLDRIEEQVRATNGRVTTLETDRKVTKKTAALVSAGVGLIVTVGGFVLQLIKW